MAVYMHVIDISIVITLASYLPFTEISQRHTFSFINVLLYCSPSVISFTPSSSIKLLLISRYCNLLFFNMSLIQLAPVQNVTNQLIMLLIQT